MKNQTLLTAVISALAASAIAGGIAWAAIPGDGGVIQGCYDSGGNLKVVGALPCPKGYSALSWNQQGVQGIPGPQGPAGPEGPPGVGALRHCVIDSIGIPDMFGYEIDVAGCSSVEISASGPLFGLHGGVDGQLVTLLSTGDGVVLTPFDGAPTGDQFALPATAVLRGHDVLQLIHANGFWNQVSLTKY
jgi:hypothetical protein